MSKFHILEEVKHVDIALALAVFKHANILCVLPYLSVFWAVKLRRQQNISSRVRITNRLRHIEGVMRDLIGLNLPTECIESVRLHVD